MCLIVLFMIVLIIKYSKFQYSLFIDDNCYSSDDTDDDDEICFICDLREGNNDIDLLIVWTSDKREWSNIKNTI